MAKRETKAEFKARVDHVLAALDQEYGTEYVCYLNHETPWQLLIAVIMSAQCTAVSYTHLTLPTNSRV